MGLDMYLERTKRVEGVSLEDLCKIENFVGDINADQKFPIEALENIPHGTEFADEITLCGKYFKWYSIFKNVGYWRKANQIHRWFVENVQGGVDDCNPYEVTKEQLKNLLSIVKSVLKNPSNKSLLPTRSGFFFGSTNYDEWYIEDLKNTKKILSDVLKNTDFEKQMVVYRASW